MDLSVALDGVTSGNLGEIASLTLQARLQVLSSPCLTGADSSEHVRAERVFREPDELSDGADRCLSPVPTVVASRQTESESRASLPGLSPECVSGILLLSRRMGLFLATGWQSCVDAYKVPAL